MRFMHFSKINTFVMKYRYALVYVLSLLLSENIFAQNIITGFVKDKQSGTPVSGASIYFPDLKIGAVAEPSHGPYRIRHDHGPQGPSDHELLESDWLILPMS